MSKKRQKDKKDSDGHNPRFTIVSNSQCAYTSMLQKTGSAKIPIRVQHKSFILRFLNKTNAKQTICTVVGINVDLKRENKKGRGPTTC